MKIKIVALLIIIIIAGFLYLNRVYARIYNTIGNAGLAWPDRQQIYLINPISSNGDIIVYVALGDSLTSGVGVDDYKYSFPYLLAEKLAEADSKDVTLINRSLPGAKTDYLIKELSPKAVNDDPDIVTLLIGINDIHNQVPLDRFTENYESIINELLTKTQAKIYIINLPYIGADRLMLPPFNYYFDWQTRRYNEVIKKLAIKHNLKYIDLYSQTVGKFKVSGSHYAKDWFHPSQQGYKEWTEIIYNAINNSNTTIN